MSDALQAPLVLHISPAQPFRWALMLAPLNRIHSGEHNMVITQDSGRELRLDAIHQYGTYDGLLAGGPTDVLNDRMIEAVRESAAVLLHHSHPAYVVPPVRTPLEQQVESRRRRRLPGKPERLPFITCMARFMSGPRQARDVDQDAIGSTLAVIWFQDDFAMPLDPGVEAALRALDWDQLARDWSF